MKKKRNRERLDWSRSIEEHPHQETAPEEMASLIDPRIRRTAYAAASVPGLVMNEISKEDGYVQRCPKCRHRSLRKVRTEDKESPQTQTGVVLNAETIPTNSAINFDMHPDRIRK